MIDGRFVRTEVLQEIGDGRLSIPKALLDDRVRRLDLRIVDLLGALRTWDSLRVVRWMDAFGFSGDSTVGSVTSQQRRFLERRAEA